MIEDRPEDINEQARLGRWYLEQKNAERALEHLKLAHESQPENKSTTADLGSALFLSGQRSEADELWEQLIAPEASLKDCKLYLDTLVKHDLSEQARRRLTPLLVKRLQQDFGDEGQYASDEKARQIEQMKALILGLSDSFAETV